MEDRRKEKGVGNMKKSDKENDRQNPNGRKKKKN